MQPTQTPERSLAATLQKSFGGRVRVVGGGEQLVHEGLLSFRCLLRCSWHAFTFIPMRGAFVFSCEKNEIFSNFENIIITVRREHAHKCSP